MQGVNNVALNVGRRILVVERYLEAESFKTKRNDLQPPSWKSSTSVKQFRQTGNVNIPKHVSETRTAEVSERLSAGPYKSL
jgi:hypothetical protein